MLRNGIQAEKLVVGVPMYGRTFILESESKGVLGEPSSTQQGFQGPFTRTDGFLGYNEVRVNYLHILNYLIIYNKSYLVINEQKR